MSNTMHTTQANGSHKESKGDPTHFLSSPADTESHILRQQIAKAAKFSERRESYLSWVRKEIEDLKVQCSVEENRNRETNWQTIRRAVTSSAVHSDDDAVRLLQSISDRVEQLAVYASSQLEPYPSPNPSHNSGPRTPTPTVDLTSIIGQPLYDELLRSEPDKPGDVLLLRYALQSGITYTIYGMLKRFSVASSTFLKNKSHEVDIALSSIAQTAQFDESQTTFGHWRAMTHRFLRLAATSSRDPTTGSEEGSEPAIVESYVKDALDVCRAVVQLRFKAHCPIIDPIENLLLVPIGAIMWHAYHLSRMIREDITSLQYWPLFPSPMQLFNLTEMVPTTKCEPLKDLKKTTARTVCTLRLGLSYSSVKPPEKGVAVRAEVLLFDAPEDVLPQGQVEVARGTNA